MKLCVSVITPLLCAFESFRVFSGLSKSSRCECGAPGVPAARSDKGGCSARLMPPRLIVLRLHLAFTADTLPQLHAGHIGPGGSDKSNPSDSVQSAGFGSGFLVVLSAKKSTRRERRGRRGLSSQNSVPSLRPPFEEALSTLLPVVCN